MDAFSMEAIPLKLFLSPFENGAHLKEIICSHGLL